MTEDSVMTVISADLAHLPLFQGYGYQSDAHYIGHVVRFASTQTIGAALESRCIFTRPAISSTCVSKVLIEIDIHK